MNIPARYRTGYLSDIGEPLPLPPGDFAAWIEVSFLENGTRSIPGTTNRGSQES
jgi:transglutaminase-like putative cysteine protease